MFHYLEISHYVQVFQLRRIFLHVPCVFELSNGSFAVKRPFP